ncbi:MAG: glycosyltransferase family 9 protein [Chloroflexi bacterium]|nr:glycosyltransferase family 9 protein [Chloroflexota bacterium]
MSITSGYCLCKGTLLASYTFRRLRRRDTPRGTPRILVVRLDTLGDVLLSEPAIAALRHCFPQATLDMVVSSGGRSLLAGNPNVDSFIVYDAPWHSAWRGKRVNWLAEIKRGWSVLRTLRRASYDVGLELRGDFRDILFLAATEAKMTMGNGGRGGGSFLDRDVAVKKDAHAVERALEIAAQVEALPVHLSPRLYLTPSHRGLAAQHLPPGGEYLAFHLGAGFPSKCLPVPYFCAVAQRLCAQGGRLRAVLVGGEEERPLVKKFLASYGMPAIDLVGQLELLETAAVLERCTLFIGNDSAPMHMAAAVGTPVVTFFGPSEPTKYHPWGVVYRLLEVDLPCRPCDHVHCVHPEYRCMTGISVDDIVAAAEELLTPVSLAANRF